MTGNWSYTIFKIHSKKDKTRSRGAGGEERKYECFFETERKKALL